MFSSADFERGKREALEGVEARDRLAKVERESASAQRGRLENGSPSGARVNVAGMLNKMAMNDFARERPGLEALADIRKAQRLGYKTAEDHNRAHEKFEKRGGVEAFNRLHPLRKDDIASGAEARQRYDPSGDVSGIEPEFLLEVARMLLAMARARAAAAPANRR